jgi:sugar lactone lactonase YvrE
MRIALWISALSLTVFGCNPYEDDDFERPEPDPPGPVDTDIDDTDDTDDTDPVVDPLAYCADPPPAVPLTWDVQVGFSTAEDFDLDGDGYLVSVNTSGDLFGRNQAGDKRVMVPGIGFGTAGTRVLPSGDIVICDVSNGALVLITASGSKTTILGGLNYPNGLEVGLDGLVYVAEQSAGRVREVDPYTGDNTIISKGLVQPNGLAFGPDYENLYVGSFGSGKIVKLKRQPPGDEWTKKLHVKVKDYFPNGGDIDGINVDECGNVYLSEYISGRVYRINVLDGELELAANLPSSWIPNMRWGHGVGGWELGRLYVSDRSQGRVFGLETGVKGKEMAFKP